MTLTIQTESGGTYPDADEELLDRLLNQLGDGDDNTYVILERSDREDEFAQAALGRDPKTAKVVPGKYIVEYRDDPQVMQHAFTSDVDTVRAVLAGWAFDRPGWKSLVEWQPLHIPA